MALYLSVMSTAVNLGLKLDIMGLLIFLRLSKKTLFFIKYVIYFFFWCMMNASHKQPKVPEAWEQFYCWSCSLPSCCCLWNAQFSPEEKYSLKTDELRLRPLIVIGPIFWTLVTIRSHSTHRYRCPKHKTDFCPRLCFNDINTQKSVFDMILYIFVSIYRENVLDA